MIIVKTRFDSENYCKTNYQEQYDIFKSILDEVIDFDNPSRSDICRLINKIVIHPKQIKEKSIFQEIEIYYNFIGKID